MMTYGSNVQAGGFGGRPVSEAREPVVIRSGGYGAVEPWSVSEESAAFAFNISDYWRILLKYKWIILGVFSAFAIAGLVITLLTTPIYTAKVTLQIDREGSKVVDVAGLAPAELLTGDEFYRTQYGLLKSEALATRVVENLRLADDDQFINTMTGGGGLFSHKSDQRSAAQRKLAAVDQVMKNLGVSPVAGSRLVVVTFQSPSSSLSARVVNSIGENFIASNLARGYESSSYAREFLEERLRQTKQKLEDSEKQLVGYAASQQIVNVNATSSSSPDGAGASQSLTASSLSDLNTALAAASGERIRAEQRWRQAQATPDAQLPEAFANPTVQQLQQERAKLQGAYQENRRIYQPNFPSMQALDAQIKETDQQIASTIAGIRGAIKAQYETALKQEASFNGKVAELKGSYLNLRERSIQYNIIQREVDTNRILYDGLLQRYKEVGIAGGVGTNNVSIVDRARAPARPSSPNLVLNLAIAALLGAIAGVSCAILLELMDEAINSPEDVDAKLGIPLLGAIPVLPKGTSPRDALDNSRSAFSEAYYSLRTALQFSTHEGVPRSLLFTSSKPSEGKSTSALAIARFFAKSGSSVLLIDADMRNPSQHRNLRSENSVGLSNYLIGQPLEQVVQATEQPNLHFLSSGPLPPNPAELLMEANLARLMSETTASFDLVVIDAPPVLGLADAPALAYAAAATILVVEAGQARRGMVKAALRRLSQGRMRLLGVLLTKFNAKTSGYGYGYGYAYSYDYGTQPKLNEKPETV